MSRRQVSQCSLYLNLQITNTEQSRPSRYSTNNRILFKSTTEFQQLNIRLPQIRMQRRGTKIWLDFVSLQSLPGTALSEREGYSQHYKLCVRKYQKVIITGDFLPYHMQILLSASKYLRSPATSPWLSRSEGDVSASDLVYPFILSRSRRGCGPRRTPVWGSVGPDCPTHPAPFCPASYWIGDASSRYITSTSSLYAWSFTYLYRFIIKWFYSSAHTA